MIKSGIQQTLPAQLGEIRALSTAAGGTALTTTLGYLAIPANVTHLWLEGRNYAASAIVAQVILNPYLIILRTHDNLTVAYDESDVAQDGDAATEVVLDALSTAANGDYLYVGSHLPFAGVRVDMSADASEVNTEVNTLTVNYWNGSSWVTASATDGSTSGGASMAVDGSVTWTVPVNWKSASLLAIGEISSAQQPAAGVPYRDIPMYWTRWQWSAAMSATVRADQLLAINRSTAYAELVTGRLYEFSVFRGFGGIGCLQMKTDTGTANLVVNAATGEGQHF